MTKKKIEISQRPSQTETAADTWVRDRAGVDDTPQKRLTIDIPASLHARVKAGCAHRGTNMKKVVLNLLNQEFPSQ